MMLLSKEPADRFPSAGALVVALDSGVVPEPRAGAPVPPMALAQRSSVGVGSGNLRASASVQRQHEPDGEEIVKWSAPAVIQFRRKLAPYLMTNFILVLLTIFTGMDLIGITAIWTVYIAWRYARLWSDGYDWRDVFKQPKDRLLVDVISETVEDGAAMLDPKKREELRERRRLQVGGGGLRVVFESNREGKGGGTLSPVGDRDALALAGAHASVLQQAISDRNEVHRLLTELPKVQREALPDVGPTATALADKVRVLAQSLADLERAEPTGGVVLIEREIETLEGQANPLEAGSEDRVRRLSQLRRQRRALLDVQRRREQATQKLETCRLALQNMKLDLLRLKAGQQSQEHVTTMTERAQALARDIDAAVYAGDQIAQLSGRRSRPGTAGA
jgi:serine/threonine-protein kinase